MRAAYFLSWIFFLATVLFLAWESARPYHFIVGLFAFPGVVIAGAWTVRKGQWILASLAISILIVLAYLAWWAIEVLDRYSVDSAPGLLGTISVQFRIPRLLFAQRVAQDDLLGALVEAYWQIGMPVVQLVFIFVLLRSVFSLRRAASA